MSWYSLQSFVKRKGAYLEIWFLYQCRWAHRSAGVSEGAWPPRPQTDVKQMHQPAAWSHHTHPRLADTCTPTVWRPEMDEGESNWEKDWKRKKQRENATIKNPSNAHKNAHAQGWPTFWRYPDAVCVSKWETSCGCVHLTGTTDNWATEAPNLENTEWNQYK